MRSISKLNVVSNKNKGSLEDGEAYYDLEKNASGLKQLLENGSMRSIFTIDPEQLSEQLDPDLPVTP